MWFGNPLIKFYKLWSKASVLRLHSCSQKPIAFYHRPVTNTLPSSAVYGCIITNSVAPYKAPILIWCMTSLGFFKAIIVTPLHHCFLNAVFFLSYPISPIHRKNNRININDKQKDIFDGKLDLFFLFLYLSRLKSKRLQWWGNVIPFTEIQTFLCMNKKLLLDLKQLEELKYMSLAMHDM